jgi:dihydrofolate synthase / folylpolyglutamate synthase
MQRSFEDWMAYLYEYHPLDKIEFGLERIRAVAQRLNLLSWSECQVITVAGTNGKGSTCCVIESVLCAAGLRVGVFSSPHIQDVRERIRINNAWLAKADYAKAFVCIDQARQGTTLTFFEWMTLAALYQFKQHNLDCVVLEVGMGGRLDATNIIDADISVITSIGLDHMAYLGTTPEAIGAEKAGILRSHQVCVSGVMPRLAPIDAMAEYFGTKILHLKEHFTYQAMPDETWTFTGIKSELQALPRPRLALINAALGLAALEQLPFTISIDAIHAGLKHAKLPGRMEVFSQAPWVVLDIAHNQPAVAYLAEQWLQRSLTGKRYAIFGAMMDKDMTAMISELAGAVDHWFLVALPGQRAASKQQLQDCFAPLSFTLYDEMAAAWSTLQSMLTPTDSVLIFGSCYTVAEFKQVA